MTGKCVQILEGHGHSVNSVTFSQDDQKIASGSIDQTIRTWEAVTGKCAQTLKCHGGWVTSVIFSHDDQKIALASAENTIRIWDAIMGKCVQMVEGHGDTIYSVILSRDGRQIASSSANNTFRIWETTTGRCTHTLEGYGGLAFAVIFSCNDKYIASGLVDKTIRIWETTTGKCTHILEGHGSSVDTVMFSCDDKYIASGSADNTIRIWETTTGKHWAVFGVGIITEIVSFDTRGLFYTEFPNDKCHIKAQALPGVQALPQQEEEAVYQVHVEYQACYLGKGQEEQQHGYGVSADKSWVTWRGHKFLWLPSACRPDKWSVSLSHLTIATAIAIACRSGRVLVIGFSRPPLSPSSR